MTPPIASWPYRLEAGPLTISIFSICDKGIFSIAVRPAVAESILMPSNKITECVELAPLRNSVETFPCPPLFDIYIPGCLWRSSGSEEDPASLISSSEITVMSAMTFFLEIGVRVAVTKTSEVLSVVSAKTLAVKSWVINRLGRIIFFIVFPNNHATPHEIKK